MIGCGAAYQIEKRLKAVTANFWETKSFFFGKAPLKERVRFCMAALTSTLVYGVGAAAFTKDTLERVDAKQRRFVAYLSRAVQRLGEVREAMWRRRCKEAKMLIEQCCETWPCGENATGKSSSRGPAPQRAKTLEGAAAPEKGVGQ